MVSGRRLVGALALSLAIAFGSGCGERGSAPVRLADHVPGGELVMGGLLVRGLDPAHQEQVIPLPSVQGRQRLVFTLGSKAPDTVVRFEVALRSTDGSSETIYHREVPSGAWVDDEVDLAPFPLAGRALVFRKTVIRGPSGPPSDALWGDPVLLPRTPLPGPLVILVSLDTMRADRVAAYAPDRGAVTPALDALAASGALFETAYAPSTWTLPSHRALLSGRFPADLPFGKTLPSIADTLRAAGYLTAAFTGGGYVGRFWGFDVGFERYYEYARPEGSGAPACTPARLDGPEVFRLAGDWLRRFGRHPGFLFVHTYDAHDRCPFFDPARRFDPPHRKDLEAIVAHYAKMVTSTDQLVAGLVREIDALDRDGPTILIVTSDHGEALFEHATSGHGPDLRPYEELVRVPLLIRMAGVRPGIRVAEPVGLADVAPTVLTALGLPVPAAMRGRVLPGLGLPRVEGPHPIWVDAGSAVALRVGEQKLVSEPARPANDQIFDLVHDPGERVDVRAMLPAVYDDLRQRLEEYAHPGSDARTPEVENPALRERLRALGYAN